MKDRPPFGAKDTFTVYADSKLCNMVFTRELHRRYGSKGLTVLCLHPGTVTTEVHRDMHWLIRSLYDLCGPLRYLFVKSAATGCETSVYAAVSSVARKESGKYLVHCRPAPYNVLADDEALGKKLWEWSDGLTSGF